MTNITTTKRRVIQLSTIFFTVCAGYLFADNVLFAKESESKAIAPACTLGTEACQFNQAQASLAEDTVTPLVPTSLKVVLEEATPAPTHLLLEVEGVEMDMGIYKLKLTNIGNQTFQGDVMLPLCMHEEMTWRGQISSPDNQTVLPVDIRMVR
ncbi:hypothetical protein [Enterovibrio coralii]|uniref:Uncharacterized protein n=1 Tax=Enterovibrio coralii TaxID=294935 RepID=A0A135ICJ7_9GAMM|nr:hypothetical protein [Enterovibrio coralii]KXF83183.1 hypothetical protein ATN88_05660 [Enterovibrio coralii]